MKTTKEFIRDLINLFNKVEAKNDKKIEKIIAGSGKKNLREPRESDKLSGGDNHNPIKTKVRTKK